MKKKLFVVLAAAVFLLGSVTAVSAFSPTKLLLNGEELKSDVPPKIEDGRLLVPTRVISEALGANVVWDEKDNTVDIQTKETQSSENRVQNLEAALAPKDQLSAAEAWAEAVKMRNGAWQYALMSPELKEKNYESMVASNWSTGVSSPWVESYTVTENEKIDNETYKYKVNFTYTDSTKALFVESKIITVKKYDSGWLISSISQQSMIEGQVTKITNNGSKVSFLVEDKSAEEPYDKAHITIMDDTKIYKGQTNELLSVKELEEGAAVEVLYSGEALMSYPVRVGADIIRILP